MPISYFIPLTKADEARREVWGIAAVEEPDVHREILDYELSKPNFVAWSERMNQTTGGKSKGNVRAMHKGALAAVGKVIHFEALDDRKAFFVGAKIVDDDAWAKVQEGVYTGFSVGGRYGKRFPDALLKGYTRYEALPSEISLVDVPAAPTARFDLVKMDGVVETREFLAKGDSLDEQVNKVRAAFDDQFNQPAMDAVPSGSAWVIDVQTDQVIVDKGADGLFAYPYSIDAEGVVFGAPSAVEKQYVLKKGASMEKLQEILSQMESSESQDVKALAAQIKAALSEGDEDTAGAQSSAAEAGSADQSTPAEKDNNEPGTEPGAAPEGQGLSADAVRDIVIGLLVELGLVQKQDDGGMVKFDGATRLEAEITTLAKGLGSIEAISARVDDAIQRTVAIDDLQKSVQSWESRQQAIVTDLAAVVATTDDIGGRVDALEKRGASGPVLREVPLLPADQQTLDTLKKMAESASNPAVRQHIQAEIARLGIKAAQNNQTKE